MSLRYRKKEGGLGCLAKGGELIAWIVGGECREVYASTGQRQQMRQHAFFARQRKGIDPFLAEVEAKTRDLGGKRLVACGH